MSTATVSSTLAKLFNRTDMQVLPPEIRKTLPPLYANEEKSEDETSVVLKLFFPFASWTWYITEGSPVDADGCMIGPDEPEERQAEAVDFLFFGLTDGDEAELGYMSLTEMMSVKKLGLGLERDEHWTPKTLAETRKLCNS